MKEVIATLATEIPAGREVTAEAIRKWEERGRVPFKFRLPLLELAKRKRVPLSERDFDFPPKAKRQSRAA